VRGGGPAEWKWFNLYQFISETLLLPKIGPLFGYLAADEEYEISFFLWRIIGLIRGRGGGRSVMTLAAEFLIVWNFSVTGNPHK